MFIKIIFIIKQHPPDLLPKQKLVRHADDYRDGQGYTRAVRGGIRVAGSGHTADKADGI